MKKVKWYVTQFRIYTGCIILFMVWYFIIATNFSISLKYETEVFSILIGLLATSGALYIGGEIYDLEYKNKEHEKRRN